ncbi:MAG: SLBB domain-containing protein [Candidatus Marinimicrobia bacterium]|nr:SLBB domain-containing protein [Candidatus Neomarinimicrobiota bacterium]
MGKIIKTLLISILILSISFGQNYGKRFQNEEYNREQMQRTQEEMPLQQQRLQTFPLEERINPDKYIVGPGDLFNINIQTSENLSFTIKINPSGNILIPGVGVIELGHIDLKTAVENMKKSIQSTYKNAKISIALMNIREFRVQISGAVNEPGFYTVTPITRLHDLIIEAGGFHQLAKEYEIQKKNASGEVDTINYFEYQLTGDLKSNPQFLENDRIFVPFGNIEEEGIVIKGAIEGSGYDIIKRNENLQHFLMRTATFSKNADLQSVKITRENGERNNIITVSPQEFKSTTLKAGDVIDILSERGVSVNGFVRSPGSFNYFPGYTPLDYVNMAGGNTVEGDPDNLRVRHKDGTVEKGDEIVLERGDVIIVPRTTKSVLFGEMSVLEIVSAVASISLTYLAATR